MPSERGEWKGGGIWREWAGLGTDRGDVLGAQMFSGLQVSLWRPEPVRSLCQLAASQVPLAN